LKNSRSGVRGGADRLKVLLVRQRRGARSKQPHRADVRLELHAIDDDQGGADVEGTRDREALGLRLEAGGQRAEHDGTRSTRARRPAGTRAVPFRDGRHVVPSEDPAWLDGTRGRRDDQPTGDVGVREAGDDQFERFERGRRAVTPGLTRRGGERDPTAGTSERETTLRASTGPDTTSTSLPLLGKHARRVARHAAPDEARA
jgi:hypothetical protein